MCFFILFLSNMVAHPDHVSSNKLTLTVSAKAGDLVGMSEKGHV